MGNLREGNERRDPPQLRANSMVFPEELLCNKVHNPDVIRRREICVDCE
jgi:hypothetical protein